MKDDPELQMDDGWSDNRTYPPKRRVNGSSSGRYLRILVIVILVLVFAGGVLYFLGRQPSSEVPSLQSKMIALEQRIGGLEKRMGELQAKIATSVQDPALLQRMEALTQKIEAMEKQKPPAAEPKAKPPVPSKPAASAEKKYHTVQKGETLYGISKKYKVGFEELRKLNNLPKDPTLRAGQKILISNGH